MTNDTSSYSPKHQPSKTLKEWLKTHPKEKRNADTTRAKSLHAKRYPILVVPATSETPAIDRQKYMVPDEFTMGQLMYLIRSRITLQKEEGLYLFVCHLNEHDELVQEVLPSASQLVGDLYRKHANSDGFLYVKYSVENTFGEL